MPRKKRAGTLRKSRTWSEVSGVTIATIPSGVTLTEAGLIGLGGTAASPTSIGYLDGYDGSPMLGASGTSPGFMVSGDSIAWADTGASVSVNFANLGITKLYGFSAVYVSDVDAGVSAANAVVLVETTPTGVSMQLKCIDPIAQAGASIIASSGGSIYWMAFHT